MTTGMFFRDDDSCQDKEAHKFIEPSFSVKIIFFFTLLDVN